MNSHPLVSSDAVVRPSASFHSSVWGDHFITHSPSPKQQQESNALLKERSEELKEEVKHMFQDTTTDLLQTMNLIDSLQLLGLDYLFEEEISAALSRVYDADMGNWGLYEVALRFRLLRQQGHNVSSDVFKKFKDDEEGSFVTSLKGDAEGLLSLYNAAYLGTHGETILDEAISFTRSQLTSMLSGLKPPLAAEVSLALETPFCRRIRWFLARNYISIYQEKETRNSAILKLAKLNFNLLQSLHREELKSLSVWWMDLAVTKSLSFARDRLVECYFWFLGVQFEPYYSLSRVITTKTVAIVSVIDDIYDSYSTLEESRLLTHAVQRWDPRAVDELPEYLKDFFLKLLKTFDDFENDLSPKLKYRVFYLRESMKALCRAFFEEAKWCSQGYVPTVDEHLQVTMVSIGYMALAIAYFAGTGEEVTQEVFDWMHGFPAIMKACAMISRISDDLASHEREQKGEHVASTVQCYMKEHGASLQVACEKLKGMVEDSWKVANRERLNILPTTSPIASLEIFVNLARTIEYVYNHGDGYTNSAIRMKDDISLLLVHPLPI